MVRFFRRHWLLIALILTTIGMRFYDLTHAGYYGDMCYFNAPWAEAIQWKGLFQIYKSLPGVNYPPLFLVILTLSSWLFPPLINGYATLEFIVATKFFSVLAEVVLVGVVYEWIPQNTRLKEIVPFILAIHPGLIATTAFWGQSDSILTLFLVLSALALNRNQSRLSWVWFTMAILMKFQAIALLPMVGILSVRRFGIAATIIGILLGLALFAVVYTPFVIGSGFDNAMRPFTNGAVDLNPVITGNAFNLWYLMTPSLWTLLPTDLKFVPSDSGLGIGHLTFKSIGFLMLGSYVAFTVVCMWRQYVERREFVWATGLYLAFFMLPTQIHERYLYPAAALSVLAIVQDRRMWVIALPLMLSFVTNIVAVPQEHFYWLGLDLKELLHGTEVITAGISLLCLIGVLWIIARTQKTVIDKPVLQVESAM